MTKVGKTTKIANFIKQPKTYLCSYFDHKYIALS